MTFCLLNVKQWRRVGCMHRSGHAVASLASSKCMRYLTYRTYSPVCHTLQPFISTEHDPCFLHSVLIATVSSIETASVQPNTEFKHVQTFQKGAATKRLQHRSGQKQVAVMHGSYGRLAMWLLRSLYELLKLART
jgi:hypothetical protein